MHALVMALQLLAQGPASAAPRSAADSAVWARADSAIEAFVWEWRDAWFDTQRSRRVGWIDPRDRFRDAAAHCHWPAYGAWAERHLIRGRTVAHASCPMWFPETDTRIDDERRAIDGGLARAERLPMMVKRGRLRALLDSLARAVPGDVRLTGQRVRFDLDAGAFRDAWQAATSCAGIDPHCLLLQGLVLYRAGYAPEADSVFLGAVRAMPEAERCTWSDVGVLLEPAERRAYEALPCAGRAQLEARLWWLADPLWLERGNERRAEHFARKVTIELLGPRGDLRNRMEPKKGGEAVAETLLRYGWPAHMFWAGPELDRGHGEWLLVRNADTAAPYVVREYSHGRLHTVPDSNILASPFTTRPGDWQIDPPPDDHDWWPVEHYARDRSRIVQLPAGQMVMLRRRAGARFAWAGELDPELLARRRGDTLTATLFDSRSPADVRAAGGFRARVGRPLLVDAPLAPGPALVGIELPGDSARPAARARFGVDVPAVLGGSPERALSQPLLFDPLGAEERLLGADSAVARMYGTTVFPRFVRLGVYWEGYGFTARDTVDVEVEVVREERPGILSRLGLAGGKDTGVGMRWRDVPGSTRALQTAEGTVPVQMRDVVLNVSRLSPGHYALAVSMNGVTSAVRTFELR